MWLNLSAKEVAPNSQFSRELSPARLNLTPAWNSRDVSWRKGNKPRAASQKEKMENLFVIAYGNFMIISCCLLVIHVGLKKIEAEDCVF